jgi:ATP-binding cassette subfamily B protein
MIAWTLNDLIANLAEFHANALYIEDFRYFLDYEPKIAQNESGRTAAGGTLECKGVSFGYKDAPTQALTDISFTVRPGEKIALVGCNGSGKTTLVKLLLHLYEPTEGQILLDGIDASEYSLESWRRQFGVVFQDLKTFSMSVAENVLMRPLAEGDEERVIEALKQSGGWDKVQSLPNGIHTTLTREFDDKGVVLSGGESQKIALARIFADPSPIVILDEPSSALDPIAEYTMFNNMLRACEGRTLLFISHRLSSAVLADRVILLDGGRIVEMGPHEELMRANGHYAEMFRKQAENYVGTPATGEVDA